MPGDHAAGIKNERRDKFIEYLAEQWGIKDEERRTWLKTDFDEWMQRKIVAKSVFPVWREPEMFKGSVAADNYHTVISTNNGQVWTWGRGNNLQLGHGSVTEDQVVPKRVEAMATEDVAHVAAGENSTVAVTRTGEVWTWGSGDYGKLGHGQIRVVDVPRPVEALEGKGVVQVAVADTYMVAVTRTGDVWEWGQGSTGRLGHNTAASQLVPIKVKAIDGQQAFDGQNVVQIAAGRQHTAALTRKGEVWTWGYGPHGQINSSSYLESVERVPKRVEALVAKNVVQVAAGDMCTVALTSTGDVWAWGINYRGLLGLGDYDIIIVKPTRVHALAGQHVVHVALGRHHTAALTSTGAVWTWGLGSSGQLGHGDSANYSVPKRVEALNGAFVVAVDANGWHTVAITTRGEVYVWGDSIHRRLSRRLRVPTKLPNFNAVIGRTEPPTRNIADGSGPVATLSLWPGFM